jgi:carbon starvation protein
MVFSGATVIEMPAFTGWTDTHFFAGQHVPALFYYGCLRRYFRVPFARASGTTAKQLSNEKYAKPIGYGSMLIECLLALIALIAVGSIWSQFADRSVTVPTTVLATGVSTMLGSIFGEGIYTVTFALIILAVSAFCLTSLDTASALHGTCLLSCFERRRGVLERSDKGIRKILANPYIATLITVVIAFGLERAAMRRLPLFGAANQLLSVWRFSRSPLGLATSVRRKMFFIPMAFMIIVTLTSLIMTGSRN